MTMETAERTELLKVGELARLCSKTVRALHLYEDMGLLEPATRTAGGFRLYPPQAVERIRWLGKLQDLGLSLNDVRQLLDDWSEIGTVHLAMDRLRQLLDRRLRKTRTQMERLRRLEDEMIESIAYLQKCNTCDATHPALCASCDVQHAPTLITQFHCTGTGEHPALDFAEIPAEEERN